MPSCRPKSLYLIFKVLALAAIEREAPVNFGKLPLLYASPPVAPNGVGAYTKND